MWYTELTIWKKISNFARELGISKELIEKAIENGVNLDTVKESDLLLLVLMSLRMGQRMKVLSHE